MERRHFIKATCGICLLAAAGAMLPSIAAYGKDRGKVYKTELNGNNEVIIPLELFNETTLQVVRVKKQYYDIAVHKKEDGTFDAILMKCTHMDNQLTITGEGFHCNLHGSEFDKQGAVVKGPAEQPLTMYTTTINEGNLIINIPKQEEEQ